MNALRLLVPCLLLALRAAPAQDQATTLLAAATAADVVVVARVEAATDPTPEWHRLELRTLQTLKGDAPATFVLLEPAGACCGRSLFALGAGDVRLLFLQRRPGGWHPFGGGRGVVPALPAIVAHVDALLAAAGNERELSRRLVAALAHLEPRVADDAAHALAALPQPRLQAAERTALGAALQQAVALGSTRAVALAEAAARVADDALLDTMLGSYVRTARDDQARMLRGVLRRCSAGAVAARLPLAVGDDHHAVRAAELLVELPESFARDGLQQLLRRSSHPRLLLAVTEGLLANGARGAELAQQVPAPVLDLAERRVRAPRPFRNVDPNRR